MYPAASPCGRYHTLRVEYQGFMDTVVWSRVRGGLVFKVHRLLYHPTLGLRVIKKKEEEGLRFRVQEAGWCFRKRRDRAEC